MNVPVSLSHNSLRQNGTSEKSPTTCDDGSALALLAKDWSCDSTCRASTSRGQPSRSSGDCDAPDSYSYCSDQCSCDSTNEYFTGHCGRQLAILDSTAKLHKSKWENFKEYLKRHFKRKATKLNKVKAKTEDNDDSAQLDDEMSDANA